MPDTFDAADLLAQARAACAAAYAPYSNFPVGAALLCADGSVVRGVNVENASYGLTNCAERSAIFAAISTGKREFRAIAIWAEAGPGGRATPCGACRQVLAEFLAADTPVILAAADGSGAPDILSVGALLPLGFRF